eukprot:gene28985-32174_t
MATPKGEASGIPLITEQEKMDLINKYEAFVFDLDGTLWTGNVAVPGASEVVDLLRYNGKRMYFVTNNATYSRSSMLKKFQLLGIKANLEEMFGSAYAAANYLKNKRFTKKVYVIGEEGIMDEMAAVGIKAVGGPNDKGLAAVRGPNDEGLTVDFSGDSHINADKEIGAVVVGLDRNISYFKIQYALTCLLENPGCLFIATNTDSRGNFSTKQEWAGAGAMVPARQSQCLLASPPPCASEAEPVVVGKPAPFLLDTICRQSGLSKDQICVVGDRLDTDVLWAERNGCGSLLARHGCAVGGMKRLWLVAGADRFVAVVEK